MVAFVEFENLFESDGIFLEYGKIEPQHPNIEYEDCDSSPCWKIPRKCRLIIDREVINNDDNNKHNNNRDTDPNPQPEQHRVLMSKPQPPHIRRYDPIIDLPRIVTFLFLSKIMYLIIEHFIKLINVNPLFCQGLLTI
jgi:hypothetical protein